MNKSLFSLIAAAGLLAAGGMAQAQTYVVPGDATIVGNSVMILDTPSTPIDTTVLGAGPSVVVPSNSSVYVQPGWNGDYRQRHEAAATFNVPARAGEASTMTGGQPNMLTDNNQVSNNIYVPVYTTPY
jgi:hypothetical protein